jgi:acetylornithine/succinyldiaminopimelate/putrescine aminotransferase
MDKREIIRNYARYVSKGKVNFYLRNLIPLVMDKRDGCYFYDFNGKKLLNFHCNGGVFNLGHRNPQIIRTLISALNNFDIGNHHLISSARASLGKRLAQLTPGDISKVVYGVSGGEAVDLAIKLARGWTKKNKIISAIGGYHGHTGFALACGDEKFKKPFGKLVEDFIQVPFGDIEAVEKAIDSDTAGIIMETIPATLGIVIPPKDYFPKLREICNRHNALLIIDEIQTGLGRCGKFLAIEEYNITPDIIVLGKGLSGGIYPITATCFREKFDKFFEEHPFIHISTFGGSELGCLVALEVLNITSSKNFLQNVNNIAEYFRVELTKIKEEFSDIFLEIRQKGLMMGLKFASVEICMLLCKILYDNGLFAVFSGNDETVLQFLPPLIITKKDADLGISILRKSLLNLKKNLKYKIFLSFLKIKKKSPV